MIPCMHYAGRVQKILPSEIRRLFSTLDSPAKIQDFLDSIPINFEPHGETNLSPLGVLRENRAHCFEGAVLGAAIFAFHGHRPLLMDFATDYDDEDHTIALFSGGGGSTSGGKKLWGALSKTNHAILRYRDLVYASPRELAMSYFHEYYLHDGRKSLRAYSVPLDLTKYPPEKWITPGESPQALDWLMAALAKSRYFPLVSQKMIPRLRRVSNIELESLKITEYQRYD